MNTSPWPADFLERHANAPTISVQPSMTDEDVEFHSDLTYLKELLHDIWVECAIGHLKSNPFPARLSQELDTLSHAVALLGEEVMA